VPASFKIVGESCDADTDCDADLNLECATEALTCKCAAGFEWNGSGCADAGSGCGDTGSGCADAGSDVLKLVSVLTPLFAAGLLTLCVLVSILSFL
jgi:hypothetical protein